MKRNKSKSARRTNTGALQGTKESKLSTKSILQSSTPRQATRRPARVNQPAPLPQNDKPIERVEFCCNGCAGRAKKLLKRYDIRLKLIPCSEQCQYYHTGVILSNPKKLDIESLLLRDGFVHIGEERVKDNGAFSIIYEGLR